jgi:hypothetical protein
MKGINVIEADTLKEWDCVKRTQDDNWVLARPHGDTSLLCRLKLAYQVFTGRADVLVWANDQ